MMDLRDRLDEITRQVEALQLEAAEIRRMLSMKRLRITGLIPDMAEEPLGTRNGGIRNGKIRTVKLLRELTGLGLAPCVEMVRKLPSEVGYFPVNHPIVVEMIEAGATFEVF